MNTTIQRIVFSALLLSSPLSVAWASGAEKGLSRYDPKTLAFVTNRDSNDIAVIDTETDRVIARIPLGAMSNAHMAQPTHDGKKLLVSATGRNQFLVVDLATLNIEHSIQTGAAPEHFGLTPDNQYATVGNMGDASVSLVDLNAGKELQRFAGFPEPHGFSFSPQNKKVYVSSFGAHEVRSFDLPTQEWAMRHPIGTTHRAATQKPKPYQSALKGVAHPTLSMDGKYIYAADGDSGQVGIIDVENDRLISTIKVGKAPWRAYASPDGLWMLVLNNGDHSISVISTATQKVVATLKGGADMSGVNFVQGGQKAYVVSQSEGAVDVFDLRTFKKINRLKLGENLTLETAATSADGKKVYVASSSDGVNRIADVGRFPWGISILGAASANYCH